jgi:hypothetical protein
MKLFIYNLLLVVILLFPIENNKITTAYFCSTNPKNKFNGFNYILEKNSQKIKNHDPQITINDSISLKDFWSKFQIDLINKNIENIVGYFEFPIHSYYFVLFRFTYDCDTVSFIQNEKIFYNVDIDSLNFFKYYEFMFFNELIEIIKNTSYEKLIKNSLIYEENQKVIYRFFIKDYFNSQKCYRDNCLVFYIHKDFGKWIIKVSGS